MKKSLILTTALLLSLVGFSQSKLTLKDAVLGGRQYIPQGILMAQWIPGTDLYSHVIDNYQTTVIIDANTGNEYGRITSGQINDALAKGNYEIKVLKETATFSVRSEGDVRTEALKCRYEKTDGNVIQQVGGKIKTTIDGGSISCVSGGAFDGMASAPSSNSYDITVSGVMKTATSGNYVVEAGGNIDMDASAIYLN